MNISINCSVSISKKLRSYLGGSGSLTLILSDMKDGKGMGTLTFSSDLIEGIQQLPEDLSCKETNISLTPISVNENSANNGCKSVGSIFSTINPDSVEPVIKKIAAVTPPERGQESKAIKTAVVIPPQFSELSIPDCKSYVSNLQELIEEATKASSKLIENIDLNSITNVRQRAIAEENLKKAMGMDKSAFIVNETIGKMSINDIGLTLHRNNPINLANYPASSVLKSNELQGLIKQGYIKIITPQEADTYMNKVNKTYDNNHGLSVFSSSEEAEAAILSSKPESNYPKGETSIRQKMIDDSVSINVDGLDDEPTELEGLMMDLTTPSPVTKMKSSDVVRRTVHSNGSNSNAIPTIKRRN